MFNLGTVHCLYPKVANLLLDGAGRSITLCSRFTYRAQAFQVFFYHQVANAPAYMLIGDETGFYPAIIDKTKKVEGRTNRCIKISSQHILSSRLCSPLTGCGREKNWNGRPHVGPPAPL